MAWLRVLVLAVLWPGLAVAEASVNGLRALVTAGRIAPVEAALQAAVTADMAGEPDAQRKLFTVFTASAPEIEAFLTGWTTEKPDTSRAQTAMGWHLWKRGWNMRGEGRADQVHHDAMRPFMEDHAAALDLAHRAVAADPDLIAASDLLLRLAASVGEDGPIRIELERVMARYPNRASLLRAMKSLAPQWRGSPAQVKLLCERFAPMVVKVAGHDQAVCAIDAVYAGGFWVGAQRNEVHQLLTVTPNPVLDYARLEDELAGYGSYVSRIKALERLWPSVT